MRKRNHNEEAPQTRGETSSDTAVSGLIAQLTHELKTPLHSIMSVASVLEQEMDGPLNAEQKRQVGIIQRNGGQLLSLITELLSVSSLSFRTLQAKYEPLKLKSFLLNLLEGVQLVAEQKGINFESDLGNIADTAAGSPFVSDSLLLKQIINNLIQNAIKFCPPAGTVSFYSELDDAKNLKILVVDSGTGISLKDQEKVFQEFYQSASSAHNTSESVGLGLSLVNAAVEQLGGTIELKSEVERGALFRLVIPSNEPKLAPKKILLLEPDELSAETLTKCLQSEGYSCSSADPEDAIEASAAFKPDLVIIDAQTAEAHGREWLSALQAAEGQVVPLVGLSAFGEPEERLRATALGIKELIEKPFDVDVLLSKIARYLA